MRWIFLLSLPFLVACSDDRATFEIGDGGRHFLSLIRITQTPWAKSAEYSLVASRMPDCVRRHALPNPAGLNARFEVYSPGNDAWILRLVSSSNRMYVVETRTCEGFARLGAEPEGGLGTLMGTFETRGGAFVFTRAPAASPQPPAS